VKAIVGNKLAPGYADHVLARDGYAGQMTGTPAANDRPDNLWAPLPGDHGAHGTFTNEARSFSPVAWLSMNKLNIAASLAFLASAFFTYRLRAGQ
jgi:hypothetical protein